MINKINIFFWIIILFPFSCELLADKTLVAPNGNEIIFSESLSGKNIDKDAWGRIFFAKGNRKIDISLDKHIFTKSQGGRYYTYSNDNVISPTGNYIIINSIYGSMYPTQSGGEKYVDRAYCSIIDMNTGCVVSDRDGEVCGYSWDRNKDLIVSSYHDSFDFLSSKMAVNKSGVDSDWSAQDIKNLTLCDSPNRSNIGAYYLLISKFKKGSDQQKIIKNTIVDWTNDLVNEATVLDKTYLYIEPKENKKSKMYLLKSDKVKVISLSDDNQWVFISYVSNESNPILAWVGKNYLSDFSL
ncbi:hypothetical protein [Pragia fontium]|uniref:SH3 domain-containing protein n=1 Tax=Pragia fontium DSM 5563 = ATCC 49100 TaxID=1122977 RepID=A0AAJ4WBM4_9GAMM|nr:hypothetical protein [Pragia fontium]SFD05204.1 hypothetical protein SAMN02745723_10786 [Pragia fontium DSM 5563 = ATCC 49100]